MATDVAMSAQMAAESAMQVAADGLVQKQGLGDSREKIDKSARDFESVLLGSWLQQAEESFAKVPGGEDEDDQDAGGEEMQGIAMQQLGNAMAAGGGVGIAKMIASHLKASDDEPAAGMPEVKMRR